ncbi:MAG: hypothetical protein AAGN66_00200 [Acidobacteriota bacterium]
MTPRIHLVDASPYIFRAFFSLPPSLKSAAGLPANATYGFAGFLLKLLADEGVSHLALAFDESLTTSFRNDFYPEYKAQRELPNPDLERQLKGCVALAEALGIATFASPRYEAEDLLATVGAPLVEAGASAVIVSSDKDLMQLVTDRVELFDFARGERYGPAEVMVKFGVRPGQIADYLGLAGTASTTSPGSPASARRPRRRCWRTSSRWRISIRGSTRFHSCPSAAPKPSPASWWSTAGRRSFRSGWPPSSPTPRPPKGWRRPTSTGWSCAAPTRPCWSPGSRSTASAASPSACGAGRRRDEL